MHYQKENERFAILFHGYKSTPFTDFSGGALLLMRMGYNIIMVDQRAHGLSEGNTLSFGALESRDAEAWARFVEDSFGEGTPTALVGISMGAGTVIIAAKRELPRGVFAVIADCPFSSAIEIIKRVAKKDMHIPAPIVAPIAAVGARLFGKFSLSDAEPRVAARGLRLPLLLIHGEGDSFVPPEMSKEIHTASGGAARLATFPDATHGTSYIYDTEGYEKITAEFLAQAYEKRFS
jgi:pimeloyl-ACP methyl ester carboxylesterase